MEIVEITLKCSINKGIIVMHLKISCPVQFQFATNDVTNDVIYININAVLFGILLESFKISIDYKIILLRNNGFQ